MRDRGGESKRGEGGNLAGTSHGEGYCEERAFLGYLRGQSENVDLKYKKMSKQVPLCKALSCFLTFLIYVNINSSVSDMLRAVVKKKTIFLRSG